jgi:hypothetical protein
MKRFDKTVVIPMRVVDGRFEYFYGGTPPVISNGVIVDLVVPEWAIEDKAFVQILQASHSEPFLPIEASVYSAVSSEQAPEALKVHALSLSSILRGHVPPATASQFPAKHFVRIEMKQPLQIRLRGTKPTRLVPAKCSIPGINKEAQSLNHAYRLISEAFEPDRIAHSGNVFEQMLYVDSNGIGKSLGELRASIEAGFEGQLSKNR